ncbi:hypothetical protein CK203_117769 [Vitis vinifera]|uniref:Transposase MuDR plant domain-containing protein n=1 Tax=Vitis vinifera TaxID=29760 RepID=A0A438CFT3_VITVI|nr:hypothetical protein CK203_117769 [Vitis vinifera]
MGPSIIKVDVLMAYVLIKESHMLSLFLKQPLDDDDDIYNMVLFNDGFSRVYVFEAHNGGVKQGVIDEQSTSWTFNYKFKRNSLKHMTACCTAGGCPWKITARGVGATKIVRVHTFENKHNHSAQEESSSVPALRPNKAALVIDDMIRANPDYLPRQICEDFERQHGVKLTYNQAWKCKEKAKERIFGLHTIHISCCPGYRLKQLVGEMEVVIISGRHHAIIRSVAEVFGVENHAYCYRHLKEDFSHQLMMGREGKDNALKLLDAVAYARLEIGYNSAMENLRRFDANLANGLKITILNTGRYGKAKISVDLRQHTSLVWLGRCRASHEMVYSGTLHPLEFQNLPTVHSDGNVHDPNGYVHVSLDPPVTKVVLEDLDGNESGQI